MASEVPFRDLIDYAIGGGWGQEEPFDQSLPVRVIRGTDFGNVAAGVYGAVPRRYEDRGKAQRRLLRANDIVLEISGGSRTSNQSTGRTLLITQRMLDRLGEHVIPASFCRLIRVNTSVVYPQFAFWTLQEMYRSGRAGQYEHHSTGISNFQFEFFLDQELVTLPPFSEQSAIAHVLGALDEKVGLNGRMNETLEATARALFKSWFVDFDPVCAKAEGHDTGLPQPIADLFPDSFHDSELGEIPAGWEVKSIGDLANIVGGATPSTKNSAYWDGGEHAWATPKDLSNLSVPVLLETERRITDAGLSQVGSGLLPNGTVLLSSRAPIGYLAVAELPVAINQGFIAMVARKGTSNLFLLLWASAAHEEILSRANGSTFLEISKTSFRPIPVVAPPIPVMVAFEEQMRPLYARIVASARESASLVAIRDSLLPKLVSGELRVPGA